MGNMRKYIYGLFLSLALMIASVAGIYFSRPYTFHGTLYDTPQPAPDITLMDQHNQPFTLNAQKGNIVLIYFGFTNCLDICPATLADLTQVYNRLGSQAKNLRVVFITVDPQRDTAPQMLDYLMKFNPDFIGLTGTAQDLTPVWKSYGVYVQTQAGTAASLETIETHTDIIYLVDQEGRLRLTYPNDVPVDDLLADVVHLLKGN
jgi:protein SCO1/2